MIMRDNLIRSALKRLGETYTSNDNRSEVYQMAAEVLESVLRTVASRVDLKFNSTTVKLNANGTNELDENRFNLPIDFLNKIRFYGEARIEGEYVYSTEDTMFLQYCRRIELEEYPDYMADYLITLLALIIAEGDITYERKVDILNTRLHEEIATIYVIEFQCAKRVI